MAVDSPVSYTVYSPITPSDTVAIGETSAGDGNKRVPRALYVGGAGTVVAVMGDGRTVSFVGAVAGSVLPLQPLRINATGTTATGLVALYQV